MKNKLLFMMLTILGAPGIAAAAGYDLANSEYNFAVNELSKSSFNQAGSANDASISQGAYGNTAMIIQKDSGNKANITQYGTQKTAIVVQRQSQMAIRVTQR